ncbi:MAG: hypothetical protein P8I31_05545, partial [Bacteroidia bacterium]|nr:hypothetical protein [Bacteroidia bacterium]
MNTWKIKATLITITTLVLFSCKKEIFIPNKENIIDTESSSHSNGYPANYDIVFNQNKVNRLDIIFTV